MSKNHARFGAVSPLLDPASHGPGDRQIGILGHLAGRDRLRFFRALVPTSEIMVSSNKIDLILGAVIVSFGQLNGEEKRHELAGSRSS